MRIALIKSSSMGDVIHALPVVSDIVAARPDIEIDWLVEESFADLPGLHPAVCQTVPVAVRRWRKAPFSGAVRGEIAALRERLARRQYDLALDLQGLIKSAWLARMTKAPIAGPDWASAREPLASLAYRHRLRVPLDVHAIERLRHLAGQALHYKPLGLPLFGLRASPVAFGWCPAQPYAVLLHATSRAEKQWPVGHWVSLAAALRGQGMAVVLPWGSMAEQAQAQAMATAIRAASAVSADAGRLVNGGITTAGGISGSTGPTAIGEVVVPPRLRLAECAALLSGASAVVGVDTGLTHLAAALSRPTIALFAATPAWRFGPYWSDCAVSMGEDGVWPQPAAVMQTLAQLAVRAASQKNT